MLDYTIICPMAIYGFVAMMIGGIVKWALKKAGVRDYTFEHGCLTLFFTVVILLALMLWIRILPF